MVTQELKIEAQDEKRNGKGEKRKCFTHRCWPLLRSNQRNKLKLNQDKAKGAAPQKEGEQPEQKSKYKGSLKQRDGRKVESV